MVYFDYDTGELWRADGTKRELLTSRSNFGPITGGRLSPDGRFLAFIDARGPQGPSRKLVSVDDPANVREIATTAVRPGGAEISPDGRSIAFSAFNAQNQPAISVCDLDACSSRKTLPSPGTEMHWMPDGKALAYIDPRTQSDLWAQPIDGSAPRQLTHFPADGERIWDFAFSTDGKRLAVARARMASDIVLFRGLRGTTKKYQN